MRISRDDTSWKAGGIRRRDFRADPEAVPDRPRRRARKDTRRWCRGVPGRDHIAERVPTAWRTVTVTRSDGTQYTTEEPTRWVTRCAVCHMDAYRLPEHVLAQVDPALRRHLALAERWCGDGHLCDDLPILRGRRPVRACVMCGHVPGGRRRFIDPKELP